MRGTVVIGVLLAFILVSSLVYADCNAGRPYCVCPKTNRKEYHKPGETLALQKDPDSCCYIPPKPKVVIPKITPISSVNAYVYPVIEVPQTPKTKDPEIGKNQQLSEGIEMRVREPSSTPLSWFDLFKDLLKIKRISIILK